MLPLSFPQQAIYLDALLRGATAKFNMGGAIAIRGPLDTALFRRSLACAFEVHDVQRLRLDPDGETAMQEFLPAEVCSLPFATLDFSHERDPLEQAMAWILADIRRPMHVDQSPLHGDVLFRLGADLHLWYPQFHHVAYDAYGHSLIAGTVAAAYNALLCRGPLPNFERHSYADFIRDDRAYAASATFRQDDDFWRAKFPAMPQPLPFTVRKSELTGDLLATERCALQIQRPVYDAVVRRAKAAGVTPFQLLVACLAAYFHRMNGCEELVAGTPILNRGNHAFRRTAGMFMSMMPLRVPVGRRATIFEVARRIQAETRSCYRHQRFPLGEILRHCREIDGFCQSVFDVTLVYRKLDYGIAFGGAPVRVTTLDNGAREETLSLEIDEYHDDDAVNLWFQHNRRLISTAEAQHMALVFEMLFTDIASDGDRAIREIRLSREPAPRGPRHAAPEETVAGMVERCAAAAPHEAAVISGEQRMTRGELDATSNRIAAFLRALTTPEEAVAVLADRGTEWIAALLGVMKAGCAYLPLDPQAPRDRLQHILRDSGCRFVLAGAPCEFEGVRTVAIPDAARCDTSAAPRAAPGPHSLAYIIYTSGATGEPKGVLIEHRSLANTIVELVRGWEVTARDRVLQFAPSMFDASLVDIFLSLATGAPLVIAPPDVILHPARFLDLLGREHVTVATLPPAFLSALNGADLSPLRLLVTAGEAANPADIARYAGGLTYVNAYGPTEAAVCASYFRVEAGTKFTAMRVPIGKAIGNTGILIVDEELRPLPVGAQGEICISGAGLARGYLNRPELTAARFATQGERLYRTGDFGRLLADGNIEFLGRRDAQVKVRGCRVELGEVEAVLRRHAAVQTAAVAAWNSAGTTELAAYVVPHAGFDARELRRFLASKLPAYMVPSRWLRVASLPVNSSGKVDRGALPMPAAEDLAEGAHFTAPRTALERTLVAIYEEVLEVAGIGVEADFLEMGGHSLRAVRALLHIQQRLAVDIDLADFFAHPTVEGLAAWIESHAPPREPPIHAAPAMESYPLSNAQARLWVLAQLEGGLAAYNMPLALALEGSLDEPKLERAFRAAIARHESLRTRIVLVDGEPRQQIVPDSEIRFALDSRDLAEDAARLAIEADFALPFDLARAPLLRASLFRVAERRWLLSLVVHHIVADGWSLDVLLRELAASYAGAPEPSALSIQYRDYTEWMAARLAGDALHEDRAFWLRTLAAPLPVLNLPADFARPATLGFAGSIERFPLLLTARLDMAAFCAAARVTPFMVMLAGVFALLQRYSGEEDLIVGTPAANRERGELENQIGLYVNTLPVRVRVERGVTLGALLERVGAAVVEAQQHQSYPFDSLVRELSGPRSSGHNPIFDVMVMTEDAILPAFHAPDVEGTPYSVPIGISVFDLTFHFSSTRAELHLEYNTGIFAKPRMERMARHLDRTIEAIVSRTDTLLEAVDLLSEEERRLLEAFSEGPSLPLPRETVIDGFARQAIRNPARTAVVFEERSLTYGELSAAAAQLAGRLRRAGISTGSIVALLVDRSEWMVAGVIGIMASGAACLAIDAAQPRARTAQMLADAGCAAVVSDGAESALPAIAIHEDGDVPLTSAAQLADVAYVTYTSGSTGTPKGSLIEHRSLANLVAALGPCFYDSLPEGASELLLTSIGFDVAMKQIFGALVRGKTLVIAVEELRRDPRALVSAVAAGGLHLLDLTPTYFAALLAEGFARAPKPDLRAIVLGSEALPSELIAEFAREEANRRIAIYNFYGPSECTVESLYCPLDGQELAGVAIAPIGRPVANSRAYVLDPAGRFAPIGIPGEICLGGLPVGRGYLNLAELTASRFVEDPFHRGERIYRTGDRGRWSAEGTLEFLGRADRQLKVRGYRIEPGEIEYHLLRHPGVSQAAVEGRTGPGGSTELIAYVVASATAGELRAFLKLSVPEHMLPAAFEILESMPVTPNGKLDRAALPAPAAPRDAIERQLLEIWERLLEARPIGIDQSFFEIGGHSLLAVRLAAEIEKHVGQRLPLGRIFESPTIARLAVLLRNGVDTQETSCLAPIRAGGSRPPLFLLPGGAGIVSYLHPLARQLPAELPVYAFQARGLDGKSAPHATVAAMAADYVDLLLEVQPQGPYFLAGHSFGGQVAFAMACLLVERGQEIGLLAIADAAAPAATPNALPLPIAVFRASERLDRAHGEDLGWSRYSNQTVRIHDVPGNHETMMQPPHVAELARMLTQAMDAAPDAMRAAAAASSRRASLRAPP